MPEHGCPQSDRNVQVLVLGQHGRLSNLSHMFGLSSRGTDTPAFPKRKPEAISQWIRATYQAKCARCGFVNKREEMSRLWQAIIEVTFEEFKEPSAPGCTKFVGEY
jgi:hypothetical protein